MMITFCIVMVTTFIMAKIEMAMLIMIIKIKNDHNDYNDLIQYVESMCATAPERPLNVSLDHEQRRQGNAAFLH